MMEKSNRSSAILKILRQAFRRKQISHPEYSMRALARDLKVSPAYVTNLLSGKKSLPAERISEISKILELDVHERQALFEAVILTHAPTQMKSLVSGAKPSLTARSAVEVGSGLLSNWYNIAVLEGLTLQEPENSINNLQRRLKLSDAQMAKALKILTESGAIDFKTESPTKRESHLYIPTGRSKREVRSFHEQMILKAHDELAHKNSDADFHRRLITGFTFSVSPNDLERLKSKIFEFLDELSRDATKSTGTDVYQCNMQFFPLTEK